MIPMLRHFIYACMWSFLALTVLVHAQSQSGFISIDCGIAEEASYKDNSTGLNYVSDLSFSGGIGVSHTISLSNDVDQQFGKLRSFPEGDRNCYTLRPRDGKDTKYLIRARFLYGDYDGNDSAPAFDLYIGANRWGPVKLEDSATEKTMEIIHIPKSDFVFVCLVSTGHGTPFISALELRPLKNSTYVSTRAAVLYRRMDVGAQTNKSIRYKDDVYDRMWEPFNFLERNPISTSLAVDSGGVYPYQPPPSVMSTAQLPANDTSGTFSFHMRPEDPASMYFVHMHFAELEKLGANESREFEIFENGEHWNGPISPGYLYSTTISSTAPVVGDVRLDYEINKTAASTREPFLNAFEAYIIRDFSELDTLEDDVEAMMKIKDEYRVRKNWQGDPCAPVTYIWEGLNCSSDGQDHRVISLNLASSGLTGTITSHISDLAMIESLDLSNNSLTGSVPDFLSKMQFLKVLDLSGNNFTGSVPFDLVERSTNGSLKLSISGNQDLCSSDCEDYISNNNSTKKKKNQYVIPVIASIAAVLVLLIVVLIVWKVMKRKTGKKETRPRLGQQQKSNEFTYSDIIAMTNNFERVIGQGGFGTVYHGKLDETEVAVKILSATSGQGPKEFQAEVKLLMRVHHRNLTSLIGFCNENGQMGLIYEYMANGNLALLLSEKNAYPLSWEDRMRVSVDAAQGLEYLHHGCRPPIIHRDIKPANILLNEKFQAKLADFGLSRDFSVESATHVSTALAGTLGFLDPECFETSWLNEKSDVYSFGVVLLQMITNQPAIIKINDHDNLHLSGWVNNMMKQGEIKAIVDPRIGGDFDVSSAWKAVEVATACVRSSRERPTMNEVVIGLKESLALETASSKQRVRRTGDSDTSSSTVSFSPLPK